MDEKALIESNIDIQSLIFTVRGKQVMLDSDLASLYDVETRVLNQAVKRNIDRFPEDFMFRLTKEEINFVKSQIVISRDNNLFAGQDGDRRYNPNVFTEQGISMLSSVLKSKTAVKVSINIIRTFVEIRHYLSDNREVFSRLDRVELKQLETDKKIDQVFDYMVEHTEIKQKVFF